MGMAIDATRQNQLATRVDLAFAGGQVSTDSDDDLAGDGDIGLEYIACRCDAAVADDEIVSGFGHELLRKVLPYPATRPSYPSGKNSLDGAEPTFETMPTLRKEPCRDLAFS